MLCDIMQSHKVVMRALTAGIFRGGESILLNITLYQLPFCQKEPTVSITPKASRTLL